MADDKEALDKLLRALEIDRAIREQQLEDMLPKPKPLEEALDNLKKHGQIVTKAGKRDGRAAAGKRRAKKNKQRKLKNARQQRWRRKWKEKALEQAINGSHYAYVSRRWKERGRKLLITEEEWNEHIQPNIDEGAVIELRRYDASKPPTIDNVVVYDVNKNDVVFDGAEHALRNSGYIL